MYIYFNGIRLIHIHRCRLFLTMTLSPTIWPPARPPWLHAGPSQAGPLSGAVLPEGRTSSPGIQGCSKVGPH